MMPDAAAIATLVSLAHDSLELRERFLAVPACADPKRQAKYESVDALFRIAANAVDLADYLMGLEHARIVPDPATAEEPDQADAE